MTHLQRRLSHAEAIQPRNGGPRHPFLLTSPSHAQSNCRPHDAMLMLLGVNWKERVVATGVENRGSLVELLVSEGGKTWTIIVTSPDGHSCIVSSGTDWRQKEQT